MSFFKKILEKEVELGLKAKKEISQNYNFEQITFFTVLMDK